MARTPRRRPSLEALEDRNLLAALGHGWPDPGHLTVSVAAHGTHVAAMHGTLNTTLNAERTTIDHAIPSKALEVANRVHVARPGAPSTSNASKGGIHSEALGPTPSDPRSNPPGDTTDPDPVTPTNPSTTSDTDLTDLTDVLVNPWM